ncbi:MAG: Ig-like domain-containing protein [Planctomycetota bacterium]
MSIATALLRSAALALAVLAPIACDGSSIRLPSGANSTLSLVPSTIVADGVDATALSLRILDENGNPLVGATVTLETDGPGMVLVQPAAPTGLDGSVTATARATRAGDCILRANIAFGGRVTQITLPGVLVVEPGPADAAQSQLSAAPNDVTADGNATSTVSVLVRDANSNPIAGAQVTLSVTAGIADLDAANLTTDAQGAASTTVRSRSVGNATLAATVAITGGTVVLNAQPVVNFFQPVGIDENEPNDQISEANQIWLGTTAYGSVETVGDLDHFAVELTEGQSIAVEIFGLRFDHETWNTNGNVPRVSITDAAGNLLVEHDYQGHNSVQSWSFDVVDPDLPMFRATTAGTYHIVVTADDNSTAGGGYALRARATDLSNALGEGSTIVSSANIVGFHQNDGTDTYSLIVAADSIVDVRTIAYRLGVNHDGAATPDYFDPMIELEGPAPGTDTLLNDDETLYDSGITAWLSAGEHALHMTECCGDADSPYALEVAIHPLTGVTETEPNDTPQTATALTEGVLISGAIDSSNDDWFAMELTAGDRVRLDVLDGAFSLPNGDSGVSMQVEDPNSNVVIGAFLLNRLEFPVTISGVWRVRFTTGNLNPTGYIIRYTTWSNAREIEPNDLAIQGSQTITTQPIAGTIGTANDIDWFVVQAAAANELVHLGLRCADPRRNFHATGMTNMTPIVVVTDLDGNAIAAVDQAQSLRPQGLVDPELVCEIAFRAPAAGGYRVSVIDRNGSSGPETNYTIQRKD